MATQLEIQRHNSAVAQLEKLISDTQNFSGLQNSESVAADLRELYKDIISGDVARQLTGSIQHFNRLTNGALGNPFEGTPYSQHGQQGFQNWQHNQRVQAINSQIEKSNQSVAALGEAFGKIANTSPSSRYDHIETQTKWLQSHFDNIKDPDVAASLGHMIVKFNQLTDGALGNPFADNPDLAHMGAKEFREYQEIEVQNHLISIRNAEIMAQNSAIQSLNKELERTQNWETTYENIEGSIVWLNNQFSRIKDLGVAESLASQIQHYNRITNGAFGNPFASNPELTHIGQKAVEKYLDADEIDANNALVGLHNKFIEKGWTQFNDVQAGLATLREDFARVRSADIASNLSNTIEYFNQITNGALGNPFADNPELAVYGQQAVQQHKINNTNNTPEQQELKSEADLLLQNMQALTTISSFVNETIRSDEWRDNGYTTLARGDGYQENVDRLREAFANINDEQTAQSAASYIADLNIMTQGEFGNPFDGTKFANVAEQDAFNTIQNVALLAHNEDWGGITTYGSEQAALDKYQSQFSQIKDPNLARQLQDDIAILNELTRGKLGNPFEGTNLEAIGEAAITSDKTKEFEGTVLEDKVLVDGRIITNDTIAVPIDLVLETGRADSGSETFTFDVNANDAAAQLARQTVSDILSDVQSTNYSGNDPQILAMREAYQDMTDDGMNHYSRQDWEKNLFTEVSQRLQEVAGLSEYRASSSGGVQGVAANYMSDSAIRDRDMNGSLSREINRFKDVDAQLVNNNNAQDNDYSASYMCANMSIYEGCIAQMVENQALGSHASQYYKVSGFSGNNSPDGGGGMHAWLVSSKTGATIEATAGTHGVYMEPMLFASRLSTMEMLMTGRLNTNAYQLGSVSNNMNTTVAATQINFSDIVNSNAKVQTPSINPDEFTISESYARTETFASRLDDNSNQQNASLGETFVAANNNADSISLEDQHKLSQAAAVQKTLESSAELDSNPSQLA